MKFSVSDYFRVQYGMLRSIAAYYWKPFNRRRLMQFYQQFIQAGDLCFDIGAHLGNRSNAWYYLGAKIVAVEPQARCFNYMQKKFRRRSRIHLIRKGIGAQKGMAQMNISLATPTVSTFANSDWQEIIDKDTSFKVKWEETEEIEMITLDDLIAEFGLPRFCKIDVEGFELEVLKGLSQPIPILSLEYYPKTLDQAIASIDRLTKLGDYVYNWSVAESQVLASKDWLSAEEMKAVFNKYDTDGRFGDFYAMLT